MKTKEEIDGQAKIDGERIYPGMTANQQKQRDAFINGFCYGAEYSDQQNKEMWEEIGAANSAIYSLQTNLTSATNELDRWKSKYEAIATGAEIEIQRLTKEVEQLRANNYDLAIESQEGFEENTRLRELLGRCKGYMEGFIDKRYLSTGHELLIDIDNALNPKP